MTQMKLLSYLLLSLSSLPMLEGRLRGTTISQRLPKVVTRISQRALIELVGYGGTPNQDAFPLKQCEGDCDVDEDCDGSLVCFQRDKLMAVPGCSGGEEENSNTDFCVLPEGTSTNDTDMPTSISTGSPTASSTESPTLSPTEAPTPMLRTPQPTAVPPNPSASTVYAFNVTGEIKFVGNDGDLTEPLGICEGDCDVDEDCDTGLVCFQRDQGEAIPGCEGNDDSRTDYCILDTTQIDWSDTASTSPTASPTEDATEMPTLASSGAPTEASYTTEVPNTQIPTLPTTEAPTEPPTTSPSNSSTTMEPTSSYAAPENDVCADATRLIFGRAFGGSTNGAAPIEGAPDCGYSYGKGVWYRLRPMGPPVGVYIQADFRVRMTVLVGPHCNDLACTNQSTIFLPNDTTISYLLNAVPGERHYLMVEGLDFETGDFNITAFEFPTSAPTAATTSIPASNTSETTTPASTNFSFIGGSAILESLTPTASPSASATDIEWSDTEVPTGVETGSPTESLTSSPTGSPTSSPTASPTSSPTSLPTNFPTRIPSSSPTTSPTDSPTDFPTARPTSSPTNALTDSPTEVSTQSPSSSPTAIPTTSPSAIDADVAFIGGGATLEASATTTAPSVSGDNFIGGSATLPTLAPSLSGGPPPLVVLGNNDIGTFPLSECQGDCDTNLDCAEGLYCYQRRNDEPVPGCGTPANPAHSGMDFCVKDPNYPYPAVVCPDDVFTCPDGTQVGRTGPNCSFPCPGGSVSLSEPTPSPSRDPQAGGSVSLTEPTSSPTVDAQAGGSVSLTEPTLSPTMAMTTATTTSALTEEPKMNLTAAPTGAPTVGDDTEATALPPTAPLPLELVSNNVNVGLLGECKGDCDRNEDCAQGLVCFQRYSREVVPGCSGSGVYGADYCIRDPGA